MLIQFWIRWYPIIQGIYSGQYFLQADQSGQFAIDRIAIYRKTSGYSNNISFTPPVIVTIDVGNESIVIDTLGAPPPPQTLGSYFGETLQSFITANATAIGSDLGIPAADVQDPDRLLAALVKRIKAWLEADGTDSNGTAIGPVEKISGIGARQGTIGYAYPITFWIPDTRPDDFAHLVI